ncbi:MAG: hypothetical protein IJ298_03635 [Ruminococcus sp.]|nr:hypothetical protein [Ruminococcus sp.]
MIDKRFADEYRKAVDSVQLPLEYQDEILSALRVKESTVSLDAEREMRRKRKRSLALPLVAAVLVLAVGLSVIFSVGINNTPVQEVRFSVASATSLRGVAGARIVFIGKQGEVLTDKKGETVTAVTDEKGEAVATIPSTQEYSVQITTDGYITLEEELRDGNYYISPEMTDDTYRAVLTWDKECDLDAHLSITAQGVTEKLNYFNSDVEDAQGQVIAALDTDSETGDGPETITFNAQEGVSFRFSVASYSALKDESSGELSATGARVTLYRGESCVGVYTIDTAYKGNAWCVFEVENTQLTVCDYTYSVSAITEIK